MEFILILAISVLMIYSGWKVFEKAGQPGWAILIPFYNFYILLKIAHKPGWWLVLLFIPLVNLVAMILIFISFAQAFGKGAGFGLGLAFLGFIFFPILAFSDAKYEAGATTPAVV